MFVKIPQLFCDITLEQYSKDGSLSNRVVINESVLSLGRNQFKDVIIKIDEQKTGKERNRFVLLKNKENYNLNTKFVKEGKSSITLNDINLRIFISNCASNELSLFLKCFAFKCNYYKNNCNKNNEDFRQRLITAKKSLFESMSPLTEFDIQRNALNKQNIVNNSLTNESPKSSKSIMTLKKRKLNENNYENNKNIDNIDSNDCKKKLKNHYLIPSPVRQIKVLNTNLLSEQQRRVMSAVLHGYNIFFTGSAGTGKSFLLKYLISRLSPDTTFVTASTGIAASHIGGITLHMFAGITNDLIVNKVSPEECAQKIMANSLKLNKWRKCKCLIVDEISMVCGHYFNLIENVAKIVRSNDKPFGGIQLVLCGDFLQLPPITKKGEKKYYSFECESWDKCVNYCFELTQIKRQTDNKFINVLQSLRVGKCDDYVKSVLLNTVNNDLNLNGLTPTQLYTHRNDVNIINSNHLNSIKSESIFYEAEDSDSKYSLMFDNICPTIRKLELKIGAQIMLNKNLDISRGLVNGLNGKVIKFEKQMNVYYPKVRFTNGCETLITPEKWIIRVSTDKYAVRRHLPLQLSWALSIHKSQGMTIENGVEISLARVFECGQTYVALSRAKSLNSIKIMDFNPNSVIVDSTALQFYNNLKYV
jgi:ATP-dependent DNA helicase PIF1